MVAVATVVVVVEILLALAIVVTRHSKSQKRPTIYYHVRIRELPDERHPVPDFLLAD